MQRHGFYKLKYKIVIIYLIINININGKREKAIIDFKIIKFFIINTPEINDILYKLKKII